MKRPTLEEMRARKYGPASGAKPSTKFPWLKVTREFWWNHCTGLSPAERCVFISLKLHENQERLCWPGIRGLAKGMGISQNRVLRAIRGLEDKKIITTKVRGHRMNEYTIVKRE